MTNIMIETNYGNIIKQQMKTLLFIQDAFQTIFEKPVALSFS